MNRDDIYQAVRLMAQRPNTSDANLTTWCRIVEGELNTLLTEHPRNEWTATWTQEADENGEYSNRIPIPEDMASLITLKCGGTLLRQFAPQGQLPAIGYISRGKCFEVYPQPAEDTTYTIHYHAMLTPLVAGWSTNWVSDWFPNLYIYGILAELGSAIVHDRRGEWKEQFLTLARQVSLQGWNQNVAAGPRTRTA